MQIEKKEIGMSEAWENWRMFWSEIVLDIEIRERDKTYEK